MGIPNPGLLSGYTNGTITTYDYSYELGAIAINTGLIAEALIDIQLLLGPVGAKVPGSITNSIEGSKLYLGQLAGKQGVTGLNDKNAQMSQVIAGLQGAVHAMSSAIHEQAAIQTLQAADQIEHNSFQKQATLDALKRNDLPAPVPPSPMDEIKAKIKNAEIIHAEALLVGTVSGIMDNVLAKLSNYILTSAPIIYAENAIGEAWTYISSNVKKFFNDLFPGTPVQIANDAQSKGIQAGVNVGKPL
jgi:hypothetical protein